MKFSSSSIVLLLPVASQALQLPFRLPPRISDLKSKLESSIDSFFEMPIFKKTTDPVSISPVLSLHRSLVEIPSVTGTEHEVGEWLASYLISKNFTVETQAVSDDNGGRSNIFAYLGKNRTTNTLITSHIDVVPPYIPYKAASSTIYGRGANDAKGSVASQIIAVEELIADGFLSEGDISLLYVVGEETSGDGMKTANSLGLSWKTVIFGEPTENKLSVGHKGIIMFDVIAKGKASHSGYPHLGVNANSRLIKALSILDNLQLPKSDLLGETTLNIGRINGGVAANVIPASANASVLVRVAGDLEETLQLIKESMDGLPVELVFLGVTYGPQKMDYDVEGFETTICSYGTDIPNLKGEHKRYLYGPGSILTAHGDNEYVLKSDLFEAVGGYKKLIKESLWPTKRTPSIIEEKTAVTEDVVVPPISRSISSADEKSREAVPTNGKSAGAGEL
ncbi:hypothetical protein RUND412_004216 [Rhizina undulata]